MRRRGPRVNLSRPGRLVVVVVGSLEFPRGEAPQVQVELVQARVVAVMRELDLELQLVAAYGLLADDAAGADARASPRAIRSLGGHLAGFDRCTSLLAENTFVWHLGPLTRRARTDEGADRIQAGEHQTRCQRTGRPFASDTKSVGRCAKRITMSPTTRANPMLPFGALRPESTRGRLSVSDRDLCFTPALELHRLYRQ